MYGLRGGLGADPTGIATSDWGLCKGWPAYLNPGCYFLHPASTIAPPKAPTGDVLTTPPASGEDAQATVDALLNQQMKDQQSLDASQVQSSWVDQLSSGAVATGAALASPFGVPWWVWLVGGMSVFAMVAVGGGSPRRYGR